MNRERELKKLGAHIKKVRTKAGFSQDRLYLEAGFSRGTMSRIESGQVNPTYMTLKRIAQTLDIEVWRLLNF